MPWTLPPNRLLTLSSWQQILTTLCPRIHEYKRQNLRLYFHRLKFSISSHYEYSHLTIELAVPLITGHRDIHITVSCVRPLKISSQPCRFKVHCTPPIFDEHVIDACVAEFSVFCKLLYSNLACLLHIYFYFVLKVLFCKGLMGQIFSYYLFIFWFRYRVRVWSCDLHTCVIRLCSQSPPHHMVCPW